VLLLVAVLASCAPSGEVTLAWSTPAGTKLQGSAVEVVLTGTGLVNVEIFHGGTMISRAGVTADGRLAKARIDTTALPQGQVQLTAHAWNSPPGDQSFTDEADAGSRTFTVDQGGNPPPPPPPPPPGTGRNFLLGMFSAGSTVSSYPDLLGYHPEVTYNSSYQDDHHQRCGQPISGLNELNNYPVIPSVFTVNNDYAGSAQGDYDSCYETLFEGLEAKAGSIYAIRIDVEFYPHPPQNEFKGSFNRIVSIAKRHLPARVKYIFNPNWETPLTGASYVPESADIIGPDAYNNPQWCQGKTSTQCANDKLDPNHPGSLAWWTKVGQQLGKPLAAPEWGDDYGDGVYIDKVADWAFDKVLVTPGRSNNVVYLGYWDSNYNEDAHLRGEAANTFRRRFGNVPYTGTYWAPLLPPTSYGKF
jgi:hypothetical protein